MGKESVRVPGCDLNKTVVLDLTRDRDGNIVGPPVGTKFYCTDRELIVEDQPYGQKFLTFEKESKEIQVGYNCYGPYSDCGECKHRIGLAFKLDKYKNP